MLNCDLLNFFVNPICFTVLSGFMHHRLHTTTEPDKEVGLVHFKEHEKYFAFI